GRIAEIYDPLEPDRSERAKAVKVTPYKGVKYAAIMQAGLEADTARRAKCGPTFSGRLLFEEGEGYRSQQWRAADVVVGQTWQDRERVPARRPALAHPATVAESAAEQLEHLDVVARWSHVGVGGDDERRHLEATDLVGKVEVLRHRRADLVEQPREVLGTWCDPLVELVHRSVFHELGGRRVDLALLRPHLRIDCVGAYVRRGCDQPADLGRVLRRGEKSHATAERVADHVRLLLPSMV